MSADDRPDLVLQALAALPAVTPDLEHADRVRLKCRAALASPRECSADIMLEPAVGAACAAYALQLARIAILLSR
jgi:hypothetical protein